MEELRGSKQTGTRGRPRRNEWLMKEKNSRTFGWPTEGLATNLVEKVKVGGKGKTKSKDQAGSPLCFSWASGNGVCAKVAPGGECLGAVKRVHKCRLCLSPSHQDAACPQAA